MKRILSALLLLSGALGVAAAQADQVTAIKHADGSVSVLKSNGRETQVINSTGRSNATISDRPHDEVVRMYTREGSQVVKQGR